jgi:hypothetical protein
MKDVLEVASLRKKPEACKRKFDSISVAGQNMGWRKRPIVGVSDTSQARVTLAAQIGQNVDIKCVRCKGCA